MGSVFSSPQPFVPKVILITGASAGIGKDAALALIQRGHVVYGAARRIDRMQDLVETGGHAIQMDITKEPQIVAAVKRILQEQRRIDVLVNNAGVSIAGPAEEVSLAEGRRQFDVNFFGLVRLTQEVLPHMRKEGKGSIINISMINVYYPFHSWYVASKHALEGWSDCLRVETQPFGIKVAIIQPGAILTEFSTLDMVGGNNDTAATSVYKPSFDAFRRFWVDGGRRFGSPPSVVSAVIIKASESDNPMRRYVVGFTSRPMLILHGWFGDAVFDRFLIQQSGGGYHSDNTFEQEATCE